MEVLQTPEMVKIIEKNGFTKEGLEELFFAQMERLENGKCPKPIIRIFIEKKDKLINYCLQKKEKIKSFIPFIPIIPISSSSLKDIVEIVNKDYLCYIKEEEVVNIAIGIPREPYFIIGVDTGRETIGLSCQQARERIINVQRKGIIIEEMMAIVTHTNVLKTNFIHCTETINAEDSDCPNFSGINKKPLIYWSKQTYRDFDWGAPSIIERF